MQTIELDEASVIAGATIHPQKKVDFQTGPNSMISGANKFGTHSNADSFFRQSDAINLDSHIPNQINPLPSDDMSIMNMSHPMQSSNPPSGP